MKSAEGGILTASSVCLFGTSLAANPYLFPLSWRTLWSLGQAIDARRHMSFSQNSGVTILYVEDDLLTQDTVAEALSQAGYEVGRASSGFEAMEALPICKADLLGLITDVNLGDGPDGWEVARRARDHRPDLPIVYVSGLDGKEWTARGVPDSIMINKPVAPEQIVEAINRLLMARGQ